MSAVYVYHVERPTMYGNMKLCELDITVMDDKVELCYALVMKHAALAKALGCQDIELGGSARGGWYLYSMSQPSITLAYVKFDAIRYVPVADPFADLPDIKSITTTKKMLTDRCPKCNIAGKFGARATLLCPKCNYVIGGLG